MLSIVLSGPNSLDSHHEGGKGVCNMAGEPARGPFEMISPPLLQIYNPIFLLICVAASVYPPPFASRK